MSKIKALQPLLQKLTKLKALLKRAIKIKKPKFPDTQIDEILEGVEKQVAKDLVEDKAKKEIAKETAETKPKSPNTKKSKTPSLKSKLDDILFSNLRKKFDELDEVLKKEFLDDFANASDDVLKKLQDEGLFDVWKNNLRSNNLDELSKFATKGDVRKKYAEALKSFVKQEEELIAKYANDPDKYEKIAKEMFELRLQTTTKFKIDETPADLLEWILKFNEKRYSPIGGNKWGHTWESIVEINKKKGLSGDDLYKKIIASSKTALGDGDKMQLGKVIINELKDSPNLEILKQTLRKYRMYQE